MSMGWKSSGSILPFALIHSPMAPECSSGMKMSGLKEEIAKTQPT